MSILVLFLAVLIGVSLGLIGGGGSILATAPAARTADWPPPGSTQNPPGIPAARCGRLKNCGGSQPAARERDSKKHAADGFAAKRDWDALINRSGIGNGKQGRRALPIQSRESISDSRWFCLRVW